MEMFQPSASMISHSMSALVFKSHTDIESFLKCLSFLSGKYAFCPVLSYFLSPLPVQSIRKL